ncbi:hypothetical protein RJT34_25469 [Clitoria ternatea]|uniref:Uncharacterized protein n=1 Tax=Clitoria ternatea TaxID=43366 RepID=A0AAN9IK12_CLITE
MALGVWLEISTQSNTLVRTRVEVLQIPGFEAPHGFMIKDELTLSFPDDVACNVPLPYLDHCEGIVQ